MEGQGDGTHRMMNKPRQLLDLTENLVSIEEESEMCRIIEKLPGARRGARASSAANEGNIRFVKKSKRHEKITCLRVGT